MLRDYKAASKHCLCNAPLYQEGFTAAERIFMKYSKIYKPTINLDIDRKKVEEAVYSVKSDYERLLMYEEDEFNNLKLENIWWKKVIDFVMWRIEYVRDLRDNMEG
jgi:hypothetical protein